MSRFDDMMRYFDTDDNQNDQKRLFASLIMFKTLKNENENKHAKFDCLNFDAFEFELADMNVRENKRKIDNIVIVDQRILENVMISSMFLAWSKKQNWLESNRRSWINEWNDIFDIFLFLRWWINEQWINSVQSRTSLKSCVNSKFNFLSLKSLLVNDDRCRFNLIWLDRCCYDDSITNMTAISNCNIVSSKILFMKSSSFRFHFSFSLVVVENFESITMTSWWFDLNFVSFSMSTFFFSLVVVENFESITMISWWFDLNFVSFFVSTLSFIM